MKTLLVLSGKGGTGKTTTTASFLQFSKAKAAADCDVDAPNLHLVADFEEEPEVEKFYGSEKSSIDPAKCIGCGKCMESCRFGAIRENDGVFSVADYACEGCGVCEAVCPCQAVSLKEDQAGTMKLFKKDKVFSTAKLRMGRGNSGKLVTQVKKNMNQAAKDADLAIIDGSPGIGCPVIASVSGVDLVLVVAEPSISGINDMERILNTADILRAKTVVCVNKYDTNKEKADEIERICRENDIPFMGKIPYDKKAAVAANSGHSLADYDCPARDALYEVYKNTMEIMGKI